MKIVQIIVLYNTKVEIEKKDIFYFDNSIDPLTIKHNNKYKSVIAMDGNAGLSVVYNLAIKKFKDEYDFLQILDDDSQLEDDFLNKFKHIAETGNEYQYYLPKIISLSDGNVKYPVYKADNVFKRFLNLFIANKKNIKTINSGLIINLKTDPQNFNQDLFLYCIDYEYSRRVIENSKYLILDLKLYQNFSLEDTDINNLINRYRMIVADGKAYYNPFDYYVNYTLIYIRLALKHKSVKFLKEIIKL